MNQRLIYDDSNQQLLEGVFNNTHILIAYLDPEFNFLMVNEAYARVDEKTPDLFPGKNHFDLYPNDENQALFQKVVDTGEPLYVYAKPFEYEANPERGISHWDWSLTPVKGKAGQVIGLILSLLDVTVPIKSAEALQRSQRDLHSLMTNYPGMACRCRKDNYWQMEFVSPGSLALTGYTPEEFQQGVVSYAQIIHPDDKPLIDEAFSKAIEKTGSFRTAYRIRHKNSDIRWVQEHGYVVDGGAGQSDYLEVFITDITESRYAEEALKRSEERFRKTFDNVAVGIAHISVRSGAIYRANPMFCRILGYSNDELMDFTHEEITFPDDLGLDQENLAKLLRGEHKFVHFEKRYIARNQELIWVNATIALETDINDHPNYFIYVIEDITEKKLANERMNLLSRALEQTADIVMVTDSRGIIEYVNPAFEEVTGYFRMEVLGKQPNLLRSGKQADGFYRKLWKTILSGAPFSDIFVNQKKDGSLYYEQKTITPLRDQSGKVTNYIATGKDITERMETQERLQFMAHHDSLTTLPNRTLFLDRLAQALARARWHSRQVVIMFVDLDRFKNINDSLGHPVGDRLLKQIGRRLINNIREGDIVARFGGDEFAVLVDNVVSRDLATTIAKNMLDALSPVFRIDDHDLYITASIGISVYPVDGDESSELLRKADIAMYRAKELGKNNYKFFASDMNQRAVERLSLENSLRRAVEENQFELYYQPQVDLATRQIIGVEALIRWNHPQRGIVSPLDFIPLLEETGLIVEVGDWVVEEACRQSAAWVSKGLNPVNMSINLSPRQFYSPDLADRIKGIVEGCGVNPELFEIEITESVLMDNANAVIDTIFSLSDFGIRIALDDFGTGYSSLSYLKRFPIDTVKIDKSFVQDIAQDEDDAAIVQAIIVMCERLDISVIAEGVETDEQRDFLKENGCQRIQGYLVGRPVPAGEVQRLISVDQHKM